MSFKSAIRGLLNAGHQRAMAFVLRTVGDDYEPRLFRVWSAKVVALIGKLWPTLDDRAIEVRMRRRTAGEEVERLRLDRLDELEPIRRKTWTWAQNHIDILREADPSVPHTLHDRAADNWRPLLAIADLAGGMWPQKARACAELYSSEAQEDSAGVELLTDIREIFSHKAADRIRTSDLLAELVKLEERPWAEWRHGKQLSPVQLARLLKPFDIRPKDLWFTLIGSKGQTAKGYLAARFEDAFRRYLPQPNPQDPQESLQEGEYQHTATRNEAGGLAGAESDEKPSGLGRLADLAAQDFKPGSPSRANHD